MVRGGLEKVVEGIDALSGGLKVEGEEGEEEMILKLRGPLHVPNPLGAADLQSSSCPCQYSPP